MEQFSLEKYLENPERKIVTRDGRSVRVLCAQYGKPLLANVMEKDGRETICGFILENGKYYGGRNDAFDLFFATTIQERWSVVYRGGRLLFDTKEEVEKYMAENMDKKARALYSVCKVRWEE